MDWQFICVCQFLLSALMIKHNKKRIAPRTSVIVWTIHLSRRYWLNILLGWEFRNLLVIFCRNSQIVSCFVQKILRPPIFSATISIVAFPLSLTSMVVETILGLAVWSLFRAVALKRYNTMLAMDLKIVLSYTSKQYNRVSVQKPPRCSL